MAGVAPSERNASTSSVEKFFSARRGGDDGIVNSRFGFLVRLPLGLLYAEADRFLDFFASLIGVGGPGRGGGGIGAINGVEAGREGVSTDIGAGISNVFGCSAGH